jgi:predicted transcriptional regulator
LIVLKTSSTQHKIERDGARGEEHGRHAQTRVSIAIKYLDEQGWVKCRTVPSDRKGRPQKCYSLTKPVKDIIAAIEKAKKNEANNQLALVRKMRDYL